MNASLLKRILSYVKPYRLYLAGGILSAILSVGISLLIPIWTGHGVDLLIQGQVDFQALMRLILQIALGILISASFQWLMNYCMNQLTFRTIQDLRTEAFEKIGKVPLKYLDNHAHGNLITAIINDIELVSDGLLQGAMQLFTGIITILGTLILMISISLNVALIVAFLTPLSIIMAAFIAKRISATFKEQAEIRGAMGGYLKEMTSQQKLVRAFHYEETAQERFDHLNNRLQAISKRAHFYSALTNPCTRFVNSIIYAIVAIAGALSVIQGRFSVGMLSSFLVYANQYTRPFNEISGVITELQAAFASANRIFKLIDAKEESFELSPLSTRPDEDKFKRQEGQVSFEGVAFSYRAHTPLIEDFNLHVSPGQTVAIVGPTGSGKSTLINLLMGFYPLDSGRITLDGADIANMERHHLRRQFGMVLQDTWLFHGTIRENICYSKPSATEEEMVAAAKKSYAHPFIERLPLGYDTVLSEDVDNISQGEKQLLAIARIMLADPPMLILDEATSNIDTLTEIRIQKAFAAMMAGRTSFIIAHRLSTIREADVILVLKDGRIIQQGNHHTLISQPGFYKQLHQPAL